ncbi:MAG: hypothetical protein IJG88_05905, partial [Eggerthellaceae bacterium]|nr:hypothetical protein [Eggerthellaceae bacterium]
MAMTRYNNYDRSFIRPFEMLDEIFSALPIDTLANVSVNSGAFKMNVEDTGTGYAVTAELPGVTRDQIDVELNEGRRTRCCVSRARTARRCWAELPTITSTGRCADVIRGPVTSPRGDGRP